MDSNQKFKSEKKKNANKKSGVGKKDLGKLFKSKLILKRKDWGGGQLYQTSPSKPRDRGKHRGKQKRSKEGFGHWEEKKLRVKAVIKQSRCPPARKKEASSVCSSQEKVGGRGAIVNARMVRRKHQPV